MKVSAVADPEGGFRGFNPPPPSEVVFFFFACQYMKIPTDLDPKPRLRRILAQNPPFKEFLDPPLQCISKVVCEWPGDFPV